MVKETGKQQLNTSTQAELDDALKRLIVKRQTWPKIKNLFDQEVSSNNLKVTYL